MTEKRVYVVSTGEYSDWRIWGIFSSRKNAELFMATVRRKRLTTEDEPDFGYEKFNDIDFYALDEEANAIRMGYKPYHIRMDDEGNIKQCEIDYEKGWDYLNEFYVWAKNAKQAMKIAADQWRQRKAENTN